LQPTRKVARELRRSERPRGSDRSALAPGEAWERRRDVGNSSKPFGGTQWVIEPTRESLANNRKRVLRPGRRLPGRSVDSVCPEPAHPAPKLGLIAGAPAVRACGGRACSSVPAWEGGPAGVLRSRRGHLGVPQEPGRPVCSRRYSRLCGSADFNVPGPCGCQ